MSHFSVVVAVPEDDRIRRALNVQDTGFAALRPALESRLETIMTPWDENTRVAPYRSYEEGGPQDYWFYGTLRDADADERAGKPVRKDYRKSAAEVRAERTREAALFRALPDPVTWESLIDALDACFPGEETADDEKLHADEDGVRAYVMSTYNPNSKWDYWRIGGRWGGYFLRVPGSEHSAVVLPERDWDSPEEKFGFYSCDALRRADLDIDAMRDKAARLARERWQEYHAIVDPLPESTPWKKFLAQVEDKMLTIEQARELYNAQPRQKALYESRQFLFTRDGEYACTADEYADAAREGALPGYALVKADGTWVSPGDMGWFGMSSDTPESYTAYRRQVNEYIEALPANAWLVALDCHI